MDMATLMQSIRDAIKNSGLNLNQLAAKSGVGQSQLWRFVNRKRGITLTTLEALLDALKLDVRLVKRK